MKIRTLAVDLSRQTLIQKLIGTGAYRTQDAEAVVSALDHYIEAKIAQDRYTRTGSETPHLPRGTDRALTG